MQFSFYEMLDFINQNHFYGFQRKKYSVKNCFRTKNEANNQFATKVGLPGRNAPISLSF